MENDSNLLSPVPEVEALICYDWGAFEHPPFQFNINSISQIFLWEMITGTTQEESSVPIPKAHQMKGSVERHA